MPAFAGFAENEASVAAIPREAHHCQAQQTGPVLQFARPTDPAALRQPVQR
jgi:hypothetical protein